MKVEILKNDKEWDVFVENSEEGTFFHTTYWRNVLEKTFSCKTKYLVIRDSDDDIIGVCPFVIRKAGFMTLAHSLPYSDFGGPVISKDKYKEGIDSLLTYLKTTSKHQGIHYCRIRFSDDALFSTVKPTASKVVEDSGIMGLNLKEKPVGTIWSKVFTKEGGERKFITRFERDGFLIREMDKKEDIYTFYSLYSSNMGYLVEQPFPVKFFEMLWDTLYPENFNLLLAEKDGECVGGISYYLYGDSLYSTYVGYDRKLSSRYKIHHYLRWNELKWAQEHGINNVWLGCTPSDRKSRYYLSKSRFGAVFNQQYEVYIPLDKKRFILYELLKKLKNTKNYLRK